MVVTPGFLCFLSGGRCKQPSFYPAGNKARQITMISKCSKEKHEQRKEEWMATNPDLFSETGKTEEIVKCGDVDSRLCIGFAIV